MYQKTTNAQLAECDNVTSNTDDLGVWMHTITFNGNLLISLMVWQAHPQRIH